MWDQRGFGPQSRWVRQLEAEVHGRQHGIGSWGPCFARLLVAIASIVSTAELVSACELLYKL